MTASDKCTNQIKNVLLCRSHPHRPFAARFTTVRDADEPEIRRRAEVDWNTLALELDDLPPFDERFAMMRELYVSLPWS